MSKNNPQFPLYIPTKGRADSRLTAKVLEEMNVPFRLVIEDQEYKTYADVIDKSKLLVLDKKYQDDYDTCDDLGSTKSKGPGAARNFIWDGRWDITVTANQLGELEKIGPLGTEGLAQIKGIAPSVAPWEALKSVPTLFYKEKVLASPLLNFGEGFRCSLAYTKLDLINSLVTH